MTSSQHRAVCLVAVLLRQVAGVTFRPGKPATGSAGAGRLATMPLHLYQADCSLLSSGTAQQKRMPGAGMTPEAIEPFKKVLKDGFYAVECVKDDMFLHGDKFGDNKVQYTQGAVSNVSIVHYSMHVAPADRQPMTHEACFSFCRTVPDMMFFGIHNGRDCYCTPFYVPTEGDDSMCDAVCAGNPASMCGSKTKSSMFGMHMCNTAGTDVAEASGEMETMQAELSALHLQAKTVSSSMQREADFYQAKLGEGGDPVAADLMQRAKVQAGSLSEAAGRGQTTEDAMKSLKLEADGMAGSGFETSEAMAKAEALLRKMAGKTTQGEAVAMELEDLLSASAPDNASTDGTGALEQYYPVMYFVDKKFDSTPSTCGGTAARTPVLGSANTCAEACNAEIHSCVGFSYFPPHGASGAGLCFLMSKLKSATYYTGCGGSSFLQKLQAPNATEVQCMAKLSKFDGATLKPDPSGKCDLCLEEATRADRCVV